MTKLERVNDQIGKTKAKIAELGAHEDIFTLFQSREKEAEGYNNSQLNALKTEFIKG